MTIPLDLPPPRDWQVFEDLCCDLWRLLWRDPGAQQNGRQGQPQAGVDVFGKRAGGGWEGIQCKQVRQGGKLEVATLLKEAQKARGFEPRLERLILATTAPRSLALQTATRELNDSEQLAFRVDVFGWDDIAQLLQGWPDLITKYYLRGTAVHLSDVLTRDRASAELEESLAEANRHFEECLISGEDGSAAREEIDRLQREIRESPRPEPGDVLGGRFRLIKRLGQGAFASVFEAHDRDNGETVAIKVLRSELSQDRVRRERFFRGARKMAQLQHPGIARVIEPKMADKSYFYFSMELLPGGDLHQAVLKGDIQSFRVLRTIADALNFAHRQGVLHRDVKPANILLTAKGEAKLTDFDLVRAHGILGYTGDDEMIGTFPYISPEAMSEPQSVDARADVFSLAMTAAFVMHGADLPSTILRDPDGFFSQLQVPALVRQVLQRATAWKPDERPATPVGLMEEFEAGFSDSFDNTDEDAGRSMSSAIRGHIERPPESSQASEIEPEQSSSLRLVVLIEDGPGILAKLAATIQESDFTSENSKVETFPADRKGLLRFHCILKDLSTNAEELSNLKERLLRLPGVLIVTAEKQPKSSLRLLGLDVTFVDQPGIAGNLVDLIGVSGYSVFKSHIETFLSGGLVLGRLHCSLEADNSGPGEQSQIEEKLRRLPGILHVVSKIFFGPD